MNLVFHLLSGKAPGAGDFAIDAGLERLVIGQGSVGDKRKQGKHQGLLKHVTAPIEYIEIRRNANYQKLCQSVFGTAEQCLSKDTSGNVHGGLHRTGAIFGVWATGVQANLSSGSQPLSLESTTLFPA